MSRIMTSALMTIGMTLLCLHAAEATCPGTDHGCHRTAEPCPWTSVCAYIVGEVCDDGAEAAYTKGTGPDHLIKCHAYPGKGACREVEQLCITRKLFRDQDKCNANVSCGTTFVTVCQHYGAGVPCSP